MNTPAPPQFSLILFYIHTFFLGRKHMKRLGFLRVFYKTVSAAALECCKKIILIPEMVIYP